MGYTKIVFIDPGTNFGWAIKEYNRLLETTETGSYPLSRNPGQRVMEFWEKLHEIVGLECVVGRKTPLSHGLIQVEEHFENRSGSIFVAWEESAWTGYSKADRTSAKRTGATRPTSTASANTMQANICGDK